MGRIKDEAKDQGILKRISKGFRAVQNTDAVLLKRMKIFEIVKSLESTVLFKSNVRLERINSLKPLVESFLLPKAPTLESQIAIFEQGLRVRKLLEEYSSADLESAEQLRVLNRLSESLHRLFNLRDDRDRDLKEGKLVERNF